MTKEEYHAKKAEKERKKAVEKKNRIAGRGAVDRPFLALTILLTIIGLVMLLSASYPSAYYEEGDALYTFKRQLVFAIIGFAVMWFTAKLNYQSWRGISTLLLYLSFFLLGLVVIPGVGITVNNSTRWLGFGTLFRFQPSEIAKLSIIIYFANSISFKKRQMQDLKEGIIKPFAIILAIATVLLLMEPHLSATILILSTGFIMLIVGGMDGRIALLGIGGIGVVGFSYVKLVEKGIISYGSNRILMWKDPWIDPLKDGYQMVQSLIAIGSGGLTGVGFGKSREKFLYLPEESNDFIFAVVCEELGFIGACVIMAIFMCLIIRGFRIGLHARDRFGSLLVIGIMTHFSLQTFLNIAVVTGLIPATGISLPFFSSGGTALILQLAEMGIVLSVSRQIEDDQRPMEEVVIEKENS